MNAMTETMVKKLMRMIKWMTGIVITCVRVCVHTNVLINTRVNSHFVKHTELYV